MILIKSNESFGLKKIKKLFNQKKFVITEDRSSRYFFELILTFDKNIIKIDTKSNSISMSLPISFELFFSEIKNLYIERFVNVGNLNYKPVKQSVSFKNNIINLNYIHNIIMTNLILNLDIGIYKNDLYKFIWPNDKDIQINKLDTHITNLKNKIKNGLKIDLNIISNAGILKLIID